MLSSLPRAASRQESQPSATDKPPVRGKFIWVWSVATTFKVSVMARKDLESMCWSGLLFLPTIKLKEELNQRPLTRFFPGSYQGQLDDIRVVSGWPEVSSPNEEKTAIVSIYADNESLSNKRGQVSTHLLAFSACR